MVTDTYKVATRWSTRNRAAIILTGLLGTGLTGCGTSNGILGTNSLNTTPNSAAPLAAVPQADRAKIAIAPIVGAPDRISRQLTASLAQAVKAQRVAISTTKGEAVDYTLRGYVVAVREGSGTKLSYIWDVTNPAGQRVNRITGEQLVNGASSRDPWTAMSPAIIQTIAAKTAGSFGSWLPPKSARQAVAAKRRSPYPAVPTAAKSTLRPKPIKAAVRSAARPKVQLAALKPAASRTAVQALVPTVVGAPGDGRISLTKALQRELQRGGIVLARGNSASAYKVTGKVAIGKAVKGKQPIQIVWHVRDPKGNTLGKVSQKNQIPQGSLNGAWGRTADAAAGAAAQGILKLLPKPVAIN